MNTTTNQSHVADVTSGSPAYQAFWILRFGFTVAPILAGLDKFFHLMVNWDQYLPDVVARVSPVHPRVNASCRRDRDCGRNWGRA